MRRLKLSGRNFRFPDGPELPVVESPVGTIIVVTPQDVRRATRRDPYNCALACAFRRAQEAPHVMIAGTVAYVTTKLRGERVAMKYSIPNETRDAIVRFDKTGKIPAEGFRFSGISAGRTLKAQRQRPRSKELGLKPLYRRPKTATRHKQITFRQLSGHIKTVPAE